MCSRGLIRRLNITVVNTWWIFSGNDLILNNLLWSLSQNKMFATYSTQLCVERTSSLSHIFSTRNTSGESDLWASRWRGRSPWRRRRWRPSGRAAGSPCCCRWRWRLHGTGEKHAQDGRKCELRLHLQNAQYFSYRLLLQEFKSAGSSAHQVHEAVVSVGLDLLHSSPFSLLLCS